MDLSATIVMIIGMLLTWGVPIGVVISLVVLFKKVNRLEKKIEK
ncbi:hypothetical protein [Halobacillus litoralis]|nr:hypothetical protein [Halobacillus litoralis]